MDRSTREEWAARIARWKDSGLTAAEFASEIGVRARTLSWWKWRLSSKTQESPKGARRVAGSLGKATRISPLTFVEMTAIDTDRLEVVLASSVRIRVRPGFDSTTLGRLLEVLEPKR
jgi:hypothetical protein